MNQFFDISPKLLKITDQVLIKCEEKFKETDKITEHNQNKVLKAFIDCGVSESHFAATTGYGYGDRGREKLENVFAEIVGAEDALIRHNFVSGTHTIVVSLFGVLRPGDVMLSVMGRPYDTLLGAIGVSPASGSLAEFGVKYEQTETTYDGKPDYDAVKKRLEKSFVRVAYIQRSRGYSLRPSLTVDEIFEIIKLVKKTSPDTIVMVDNCYGEFVDINEPTNFGADLIMGSLIKNPGGGIAPTGGYIAGKKNLVDQCAGRLNAPGIGREVGASLGHTRELFMGLFSAPHVTGEAVKSAIFAAALFEKLGYDVAPKFCDKRADIVESVILGSKEALIAFCQGMQKGAPIDSFVVPEPWDMPGYDNEVIMAAGAFTMGSSIELSADAPIREPYVAWMQGGINFHSAKTGILLAADSLIKKGIITAL